MVRVLWSVSWRFEVLRKGARILRRMKKRMQRGVGGGGGGTFGHCFGVRGVVALAGHGVDVLGHVLFD